MFTFSNERFTLKKTLYVVLIVTAALLFRMNFVTGNVRGDALNYAHAAHELANGRLHFEHWPEGTSRIGSYFPTALFYYLFGTHELTSILYPLLCSLFGILVIYCIAFLLGGERAGLIAALLWSFFPLEVHLATILLPDGPMATFSSASILALLLAHKSTGKKKPIFYTACAIFLLWAILIKPLAVVTAVPIFLFAALSIWDSRIKFHKTGSGFQLIKLVKKVVLLLFVVLFFVFIHYGDLDFILVDLSQTATDLSRLFIFGETNMDFSWERVKYTPVIIFLTPIFLVALITLIRNSQKKNIFVLVWLGSIYLFYEWGSVSLNPFQYSPIKDFVDARNIQFITPPFFIVAAIYMARGFSIRRLRQVVIIASGLALLVALLLKTELSTGQTMPNWFLGVLSLTIVGCLFSPFFIMGNRTRSSQLLSSILLIGLAVSLINPSPPYQVAYWRDIRAYMNDLEFLAARISANDWPVIVPHAAMAIQLSYASSFELTYDWTEQDSDNNGYQIQIAPRFNYAGPAYVVLTTNYGAQQYDLKFLRAYSNGYQNLFLYILER